MDTYLRYCEDCGEDISDKPSNRFACDDCVSHAIELDKEDRESMDFDYSMSE
jgi:Zn finger protein HypA/HybF involved in hydrogenase expression